MIIESEQRPPPSAPTVAMDATAPDPLTSLGVAATPAGSVDLEAVRFDIHEPPAIIPGSPSMRNVTVSRGIAGGPPSTSLR